MRFIETYQLNTLPLYDYFGVEVLACGGMYDFPVRGGDTERDWEDEDGFEALVDADDIWFKQKSIVLKCFLKGSDLNDFMYRLGMLKDQLYNGTCDLTTPYGNFIVILKKGGKVTYLRDGKGEFQLEFSEVEYVKKEAPIGTNDGAENSIDGVLWSELGIKIQSEKGHFDFTDMKRDKTTVYKKESILNNMRMSRKITLSMLMQAEDIETFNANMNSLHGILSNSGLRKLILNGIPEPFEVFCKSGFKVKNLYLDNGKFSAQFDIVFDEPKPKRESIVVVFLADNLGNYIQDTLGRYILIIWDKKKLPGGPTYLYLDEEGKDDTYLYLDEEPESENNQVYLFTDNELT